MARGMAALISRRAANSTIEKFFKEESALTLMQEINSDCQISSERSAEECCSIAESMIEEIQSDHASREVCGAIFRYRAEGLL